MLNSVTLRNFRSYGQLVLDVPAQPLILLVGPNGAGKTNLLEAISLLGGGRGLRGAAAQDLTRLGSEGADPAWVVSAEVSKPPLRHKISQALAADGRLARLDQRTVAGTQLGLLVPTVSLSPVQDALFRGPAEDRRGLLDRFVIAMEPEHRTQLSSYGKAVRERNALLRAAVRDGTPPDTAWLTGLEAQMASHGLALAHGRVTHLRQLATAVCSNVGPFPAAGLAVLGDMEAAIGAALDAAAQASDGQAIEATWRTRWQRERAADLAAGRTLSGPHRSDLAVTFSAKQAPAHLCSTGEQKALLLSLFLGQARLLVAAGKRPLLLLDEVAAHLDEQRREALMAELVSLPAQTWVTGTDIGLLQSHEIVDKSAVFGLANSALTL